MILLIFITPMLLRTGFGGFFLGGRGMLHKYLSMRNHWRMSSYFRFQQYFCFSRVIVFYPMNVVSCRIYHISLFVFIAIKPSPDKSIIHIFPNGLRTTAGVRPTRHIKPKTKEVLRILHLHHTGSGPAEPCSMGTNLTLSVPLYFLSSSFSPLHVFLSCM